MINAKSYPAVSILQSSKPRIVGPDEGICFFACSPVFYKKAFALESRCRTSDGLLAEMDFSLAYNQHAALHIEINKTTTYAGCARGPASR